MSDSELVGTRKPHCGRRCCSMLRFSIRRKLPAQSLSAAWQTCQIYERVRFWGPIPDSNARKNQRPEKPYGRERSVCDTGHAKKSNKEPALSSGSPVGMLSEAFGAPFAKDLRSPGPPQFGCAKQQNRAEQNHGSRFRNRSEEHTSELQSLRHLVCR